MAFISNRSGFDEIWKGDLAQSQEPQVLTSLGPKGIYPHSLHWSPDGHFLVLSASTTSQRTADGFDIAQIYVVPVDMPGGLRQLTAWSSEQSHPVWSNDGKWIYFASNRSGKFEIWKLPADVPEAKTPNDNLAAASRTNFPVSTEVQESFDGQRLYFKKEGFGDGFLWSQDLAGGANAPGRSSMCPRRSGDR